MIFMKCEYSLHSKWFKTIFPECVWSFGENCQYPCGGYCIDQKCDRFNGSCLYGNCTLGNAFYGNLFIQFVKIIVWKCTDEKCTVSNALNLIQICDKMKVSYYSFGKCSIGIFPFRCTMCIGWPVKTSKLLYLLFNTGTQQNDDSKHITPVTIAFIVGLSASVIVNIVAIGSFLLELRYT